MQHIRQRLQAQKETGANSAAGKRSSGSQKTSGRSGMPTSVATGDSARSGNEAVSASPNGSQRPSASPHRYGRNAGGSGSSSLKARRARALYKTMHPNQKSPAHSGQLGHSHGRSSRLGQSPVHSGQLGQHSGQLGQHSGHLGQFSGHLHPNQKSPAHSGQLGQSHGRSSPLGQYDPQHRSYSQQDRHTTGAARATASHHSWYHY